MVWNYIENRPLGSYREVSNKPESFCIDVNKWIEEELDNSTFDSKGLQSVRSALESVGYDLHKFMLSHAYNLISNVKVKEYFVVYWCVGTSPSAKFLPYNTEEYKGMDDAGVDILYRAREMYWGGQKNVLDFDIYCRYYFCETEEDVLDIFADGVGDIRQLATYYYDQDKNKELNALQYIYGAENKFLKATTGKSYQACPQSVKDEIVSILKDHFLDGMDDDSFEDNNAHSLFAAAIKIVNKNNLPKWVEWAKKPNERREGRNNILPEIVEYLQEHPEDFSKPAKSMEGCSYIAAPEVDPVTWESLSETLIDQCLENHFGIKYSNISEIPHDEIVSLASGIIGQEVAEKFADFIRL